MKNEKNERDELREGELREADGGIPGGPVIEHLADPRPSPIFKKDLELDL